MWTQAEGEVRAEARDCHVNPGRRLCPGQQAASSDCQKQGDLLLSSWDLLACTSNPDVPPHRQLHSHSYRGRGSFAAATTVFYRESSKKQHLNLLHFKAPLIYGFTSFSLLLQPWRTLSQLPGNLGFLHLQAQTQREPRETPKPLLTPRLS